jgi:hypothetical protein
MYPVNAYKIRPSMNEDERNLRQLADLDGQTPLSGPALIGEIAGFPAAAVSLTDGRLIADPFQPTAVLGQVLRMRYDALRAHERTPSLRERMREAFAHLAVARSSEA